MSTLTEAGHQKAGWRLVTFVVLLVACFLTAGMRLGYLQIERHGHYTELARKQQHRTITLNPPRGTLFDATGRELAVSAPADSIFADPQAIQDPAALAEALAPVLGLPQDVLRKKLTATNQFVWLARQVDEAVSEAVKELKLPGIHWREESRRFYPYGELGAHVLGFVGTDFHGLAGIEAQYEKVVAGHIGQRMVLRDASGQLAVAPGVAAEAARPGRDLHLTLDGAMQHIAERELLAVIRKYDAAAGSVVLLDPTTGAVKAMASWPTFDPNRFGAYPDRTTRWRNRAVADAFEPGSVFKVVVAAAALEENVIDPSDIIDCQMGKLLVQGVAIRDYKPFGLLTFREVISKSSNIGTIKVKQRIGDPRFYQQMLAYGFGAKTGIDLPGESLGILRPIEDWPPRTGAYAAFGQGISVTAIQLAAAFGAIANGGTLMKPYVVEAIGSGTQRERIGTPTAVGRVMSKATARQVGRLLEAVVAEGTARRAQVEGYRIAGKTSTAQKAVVGGYSATDHIAVFAGFGPSRSARLVTAVVVDRPRGNIHGGVVAAPVFAAINRQALVALGIAPEAEITESESADGGDDDPWRVEAGG